MPNDRARFYEDALGSVRESRDWYHKGRQAFADKVVAHRMDLTKQLISLLITMITNERRRTGRIGKRQGPAE